MTKIFNRDCFLIISFVIVVNQHLILTAHVHPSLEFSKYAIIKPRLYHTREKREIFSTLEEENGKHTDHLSISYDNDDKAYVLDLLLNKDLISKNYFRKYQKNGNAIVKTSNDVNVDFCHYHGKLRGVSNSWAAISTCKDGRLTGVVHDDKETYYLETGEGSNSLQYLYKQSDLVHNNSITCGFDRGDNVESFHDYDTISRHRRDTAETIRGPSNSNKKTQYLELAIVVDNAKYKEMGENLQKVEEYVISLVNIVNGIYAPLNIYIALVGVITWTEVDEIALSSNGDTTLSNFLHYRREKLILQHPNDNAQLLTKTFFNTLVVSKALKGTICTTEYSGSVNSDRSTSLGLVASILAHSLGHNFGMEHDTDDCSCSQDKCVMSASVGTDIFTQWSSCSLEYLALAFDRGMDYCLRNKPNFLFASPTCGNGFVESGEQCDCGLPEYCKNACCNATTCTLSENATCATGECCNLESCSLKSPDVQCRSADNECDLPEYCTGLSEYCPTDVFKMDSEPCANRKAYCYRGSCRTHEDQCKLLWGQTGQNGDPKCYSLNNKGTRHGNCGYNLLNQNYSKCEQEDLLCGRLFCTHLNDRLEFGLEAVSILSHAFIRNDDKLLPCRSAIIDMGLEQTDPGLVPDGATCGESKMCVNQKCVSVIGFRANGKSCPENCSGNGICDSEGRCRCNDGFHPPSCSDNQNVSLMVNTSHSCPLPGFSFTSRYISYRYSSQSKASGFIEEIKEVCKYRYGISPLAVNSSKCINGSWSPPLGRCSRTCPSLTSTESTKIQCKLDGVVLQNCNNPIEGTKALISCNLLYEEADTREVPVRVCKDGNWGLPVTSCYPVCGLKRPKEKSNSAKAKNSLIRLEYPWHVAIYNSLLEFICAGTIIDRNIVLTAARCVSDNEGNVGPIQNFSIAAGKYYLGYDDERDVPEAQYSDVLKIYVPETYKGSSNFYADDLAVIILKNPFTMTTSVQPICIELLDQQLQQLKLSIYNNVTVLGWGSDEELEESTVTYISNDKCREEILSSYKKYITYDKICTRFSNSKQNGGGGLYLQNACNERYYLKGVISNSSIIDESSSDVDQYSTYTLIENHLDFLRDIVAYHREYLTTAST